MDIFRFMPYSIYPEDHEFQRGKLINGIREITWVERFDQGGEFTIRGPLESGLKEQLPIDSAISHTDSYEVMLVENQEIVDDNGYLDVVITGRSFETILENRVTGDGGLSVLDDQLSGPKIPEVLISSTISGGLVTLMQAHILFPYVDIDTAFQSVEPITSVVGELSDYYERTLPFGGIYSTILEMLKVKGFGIRSIRPGGPWSPFWGEWNEHHLALDIHQGTDRSGSVIFSFNAGDVEDANYLWSNKPYKNAAIVISTWYRLLVDWGGPGTAKRFMVVDASEIDSYYPESPTGGLLDNLLMQMQTRGEQALLNQKMLSIVKAEMSRINQRYIYRKDYDLGDLVTIVGDYDVTSARRVTEYVEIQDENGSYGYPTFTDI